MEDDGLARGKNQAIKQHTTTELFMKINPKKLLWFLAAALVLVVIAGCSSKETVF